jgi:hypothetical protein
MGASGYTNLTNLELNLKRIVENGGLQPKPTQQ